MPWAWGGSHVPIVLQLTLNIIGFGLDPLSDANRTAIKDGMDQILSGTGGILAPFLHPTPASFPALWRISREHCFTVFFGRQ